MVPVVAIMLSVIFEGMKLEVHIIIGMALALSGNIFILTWANLRK